MQIILSRIIDILLSERRVKFDDFGHLTNLEYFEAARNELEFPVPSSLSHLKTLEYYNLKENLEL